MSTLENCGLAENKGYRDYSDNTCMLLQIQHSCDTDCAIACHGIVPD